MNLKTLLDKLYCFQLLYDDKVYAYAFGYTRSMTLNHLKNITKFHCLYGNITSKYKDLIIKNIVNKSFNNLNTNLMVYKYYMVYKELKNLNKPITYKDLSKKTKYSVFSVIQALKHNPFLILLPCHLVVNKNHKANGYTPLGLGFREKLIRYRNDII